MREKPIGTYTRRFELGLFGLLCIFIAWVVLRVAFAWAQG
jgi:hypothetical protein